jgi:hypothetical protein
MMPGSTTQPRDIAGWAWTIALVAWVVASRWAYVSDAPLMSKDGPLYVESLRLDRSYSVPMPGNPGYVLLGRASSLVWPEPTRAFAAVNAALTAVAVVLLFRVATRFVPVALAGALAFALSCNPTVWWHGATINSYLVWLTVLPAIAFFGMRFRERRRVLDLVLCAGSLGLGTALRQDLLAFGMPLGIACLLAARASWRGWLLAAGIVAACCLGWFAGMSMILGGPWEYLARVQAKHAGHMEGFSPEHRGVFEGLLRNASKYALFLAWSAPLIVVPALGWLAGRLLGIRRSWRTLLIGLAWVGPSWAFSLLVFAGNAGLIFVLLPPLYLAAAVFLQEWLRRDGPAVPVAAMALIAVAGVAQFTLAPILPETSQRNAILNVTFLRYSGPGLRGRFDRNLDDYGIDPSLRNVLRQLREPRPIPGRLASRAGGMTR